MEQPFTFYAVVFFGLIYAIRKYVNGRQELRHRPKPERAEAVQPQPRFGTATASKLQESRATALDRAFLNRVIAVIEKRLEVDGFNVEALARETRMSVSQINRKLGALIGRPAGQLIHSMRLQRAAELLAQQAGTVCEIAHQVGFYDQSHLAKHFRKQFGCAPNAYRKNGRNGDRKM